MDVEELKAMIPSETVRNYVLETGWTFTDKEKTALLFHSGLPLEHQHFWLRALRNKTEDQFYQAQPKGYFFDWDLAYERGKQTSCPFQIEKYVVFNANKPSGDDSNSSVADLCFNRDGETITYFWSSEVLFDEERDDYFAYIFYEVPNPFERGDIIRLCGTGDYGIIETSQMCWKADLDRYKARKKLPPDYSDVQIRVVFLNEDGTFDHAHINPIDLERYLPNKDGAVQSSMEKLLLCASGFYKGEGSLDELYVFTMEYRNSKKEMR